MAKKDSINKRITDVMKEVFLMPLFFVAGIDALKEKIKVMDDPDVSLIFSNLIPAKAIRKKVEEIQQILNDSNANIP